MIDPKTILKLNFLLSLYQELKAELNAVDITLNNHQGHVHLRNEVFFREFTHYKVSQRICNKYPFLYQAEVDGLIFYAISDEENPKARSLEAPEPIKGITISIDSLD